MICADVPDLNAVLSATWPPASAAQHGGFTIRQSSGGGSRVTAATLVAAQFLEADIDGAEAKMRSLGQRTLFRIGEGQEQLDEALEQRGFAVTDPTVFYTAPVAHLAEITPPRLSVFDLWPPLAIMTDLWAREGIGADRVAVMDRVRGPKTALLGRCADQPAGTGFVAVHDETAMLHALEISPNFRRHGLGRHMIGHSAAWAKAQGSTLFGLAVTLSNTTACAFYEALGMVRAGGYHYRAEVPRDAL